MTVLPAPPAPTHDLGHTRFTSLATPSRGSRDTSVWRVEIAPGSPTSRPHSVTREEIFVVLEGDATVELAGTRAPARTGDAILIPPGTDFTLTNTGDGPLQLLCCLPVGGQARTQDEGTFTPPWAR